MTDRDVGVDAFRALLGELTQDGDAFGIRYGVHSLILRSCLERGLDTTKLWRSGTMEPASTKWHTAVTVTKCSSDSASCTANATCKLHADNFCICLWLAR